MSGHVVAIVGGAGMLGQHLVRAVHTYSELLEFKIKELRIIDRVLFQKGMDYEFNPTIKTRVFQNDIQDYPHLLQVLKGTTVVLHTASLIDPFTNPNIELMFSVNITGTNNLIKACIELGVEYLVYTSTNDVIKIRKERNFVDEEDVVYGTVDGNANGFAEEFYDDKFEDLEDSLRPQFGDTFFRCYATCKAIAEKKVLNAHGHSLKVMNGIKEIKTLKTASVRPSSIYGELDGVFLGQYLKKLQQAGSVFWKTNTGKFKYQAQYAGNIAWLHLLAVQGMVNDNEKCGGRAYHAFDDTPLVTPHEFVAPFVKARHFPESFFECPFWIVYYLVLLVELFVIILLPIIKIRTVISLPGIYRFMCNEDQFQGKMIRQKLNYKPLYSNEVAFQNSMDFYSNLPI